MAFSNKDKKYDNAVGVYKKEKRREKDRKILNLRNTTVDFSVIYLLSSPMNFIRDY